MWLVSLLVLLAIFNSFKSSDKGIIDEDLEEEYNKRYSEIVNSFPKVDL